MVPVYKDLEREKRLIRRFSHADARQTVLNLLASACQHDAVSHELSQAWAIPNEFDGRLFRPGKAAWQRARADLGLRVVGLLVGRDACIRPSKSHVSFLRAAGLFATILPEAYSVLAGAGRSPCNASLILKG